MPIFSYPVRAPQTSKTFVNQLLSQLLGPSNISIFGSSKDDISLQVTQIATVVDAFILSIPSAPITPPSGVDKVVDDAWHGSAVQNTRNNWLKCCFPDTDNGHSEPQRYDIVSVFNDMRSRGLVLDKDCLKAIGVMLSSAPYLGIILYSD